MRAFFAWLRKPRPVLIAILFLCIFGTLLFLLLRFNFLSVILFLFMAFGFIGSAATVGKKNKENAVIIILCVCAAVLCFLFSIPAFLYKEKDRIIAYERPVKNAAVFFFILGIIYLLIAVIVVLKNGRRKNVTQEKLGQSKYRTMK
jgi:hypothetical protein